MSEQNSREKRLPRNFHKSFKPERQYLAAMMRYAASGYSGDYQDIAAETGIPMGASSGKVPAILDYCKGMGLLCIPSSGIRSAVKRPQLTNFGRVVYLEDPYFKCEITQWISHMNLCRPDTGADIWYETFCHYSRTLGTIFRRDQLEEYLLVVYALQKSRKILGPLVGMYQDTASFEICGAIKEIEETLTIRSAPIAEELVLGYAAWTLQLIKDFFPNQNQVPITQLDKMCGWSTIPAWSSSDVKRILDLFTQKGLISVDRSMEPWLVQPRMEPESIWEEIYSDLI